jgi:hypothetical protein
VVVVIPDGYYEHKNVNDLIVHFHGWNNDNLQILDKFDMVQQLVASKKNAILVLVQGPYRASDSGGGKMEDEGGLQKMVEEVLEKLKAEKRINKTKIGRIFLTAHSGGYRPALTGLAKGKLEQNIKEVYLFDAFYSQTELLIPWLQQDKNNKLRSIFTEHLGEEHRIFAAKLQQANLSYGYDFEPSTQILLHPTNVCHDCVIESHLQRWLEGSCLEDRKP